MENESETFKPVTMAVDFSGSYTDFLLLRETSSARLYRASKAGRYVLLKTTKDNSGMSIAMLKREYEMSLTLNHYHIPYVFTYEQSTPVGPAIVMEYVDGRSLNEFLAEKPSLDSRRRVFDQILAVVAYIHKNGIVHNDIKPENILISRINNDVKLLDFGLSDKDAHYLTHALGCTPSYASPELLAQGDVDARSDIFSLGRIMQLIFGAKRYAKVSTRCVANNRDDRYDNVDQLIHHWRQCQKTPRIVLIVAAIALLLPLTFFVGRQSVSSVDEALTESYNALRDSLSMASQETRMYKAQVDSIEHQRALEKAAIDRRNHFRDSICKSFDDCVEKLYNKTVPIIKKERFTEFAMAKCTQEFMYTMFDIQKAFTSAKYDPEVASYITTHVSSVSSSYFDKALNLVNSMPSFRELPDEAEVQFYISILGTEPYRPYVPQE